MVNHPLTICDSALLEDIYGIDVSPDLISAITDTVLDEVAEWWVRPQAERRLI